MSRLLIIHGAGMNMRGKAQIEVFGPMTLPEYDEQLRKYAAHGRPFPGQRWLAASCHGADELALAASAVTQGPSVRPPR